MDIVTKPNMNQGIWAENGNIEIPSSEKVGEGWVVEKPLNEVMNWVQNRQDKMLQYLNQRGVAEWDFRTTYPKDAFTSRLGIVYKAISQNTDKDPTLSNAIWEIAFVSYQDFGDALEQLRLINTQDGYLNYYVKKSEPILDAPAKGISYNDLTGVSGLGFQGLTPRIMNNGVSVAEFSGGNNPKDVVTYEALATAVQSFKVGSVYITTADGNPSSQLGYGTWERFAEGSVLVGFSTNVSNSVPQWVKTIGSQFGEYEHRLVQEELPEHKHSKDNIFNKFGSKASESGLNTQGSGDFDKIDVEYGTGGVSSSHWNQATEQAIGGDKPHNNVQPSIVVYMWKRVA